MSEIGSMVREALSAREMSIRELAERLGKSFGYVARVLREAQHDNASTPYKVALAEAPAWADALGFEGSRRARFLELVWFSHSPDDVALLVSDLRRQLADLSQKHIELQGQHAALLEKVDLIRSELRRRGGQVPKGVE